MKNNRILNFLTTHFTLIQTLICLIYLIGWKIIANIFFNSFVEQTDYTIDLTFVFIELVYILIMLEGMFYYNNDHKKLTKRSQTAIQDYLKSAKHDVYISGIINNSVINIFMNNRILLEDCIRRKIKIHILFYVSNDEKCFDWYLKNMYGIIEYEDKIKSDKLLYNTQLSFINTYEVFKMLLDKNLLEFRRIDSPITTAFVARDIEHEQEINSKIQCLFYQFMVDSPDCPTYVVDSNEELFPIMRKVVLDMWNASTQELKVTYVNNK